MAEPDASDFLRAAVSPAAWAGQNAWRCLDTAFGNGQQFFAVWDAWCRDEHRPRVLHYVGLCAEPPRFDDFAQGMAQPALRGFVAQLRQQSLDLGAGFHRLSFENGHLLLTLCIGDLSSLLREQRFQADALLLDPDPAMAAPGSRWDLWRVKALARLACRGAVLALRRDTAVLLRPVLQQCGFVMPENRGPEPSAVIRAEFHPAWALKSSRPGAVTPALPVSRCVVVGAGLAGASVAAALARRGWQVLVLDASPSPAQGASSLPAGLVVPHVSVDDCSLSRLSRAGVRLVLQQAQALLLRGQDWDGTGVEQRYPGGNGHAPGTPALWHAQAGWVKPASLVRAWLAQPGVRFQGGCTVAGLQRHHGLWHVLDAAGQSMACAEQVVLANAIGVAPLLAACSAAEPGLDTFARQPTLT